MSGQINLYHPRYLKQRDWLALGPVAVAAVGVYTLLAVTALWSWYDAGERKAMAAAADAQLKAAKAQVDEATKAASARKPSAQLLAEVDTVTSVLRRREEIAGLLEGGVIGTTTGFAEHFRGLARQVPEGLWLTGFSLAAGGSDMEIRGSTLNAATVPEYIRRLGEEKAFQGKSFAALSMTRPGVPGAPVPARAGSTTPAAVSPAPTIAAPVALRAIDFVLLPKAVDAGAAKS